MMEKVLGIRSLDKLRRINMYESEYNFVLKNMWPHKAIHMAETNGTLGENQYGGRKKKNSQQVAIINEIILDYHRISHQPLSIMQHDVKACFDRTISSITNISNQAYNISKKFANLLLRQNIKCNITQSHFTDRPKHHIVTIKNILSTYQAKVLAMRELSGTSSAWH